MSKRLRWHLVMNFPKSLEENNFLHDENTFVKVS